MSQEIQSRIKGVKQTCTHVSRFAIEDLRIQMRPDDDADMPHWGKFKRRKPMTRVSRGGLPPFPFLLPLADPACDIPDSIRRTSWARVTPSFTPVLLPSVPLLSAGGEGIGGRKVLPLLYITFTTTPATTAAITTTTTADHRHYLHHFHVVAELVYTQRWEFCRFDKVVSRTQSSTARPRKPVNRCPSFGAPIRELEFNRNGTPAFKSFRGSFFSFSSPSSFLFFHLISNVNYFSFFFSLPCVVSIFAKMR